VLEFEKILELLVEASKCLSNFHFPQDKLSPHLSLHRKEGSKAPLAGIQSDTARMTSIEAKERGAAAWIAQDFNLAITHFSTAIEIGGDKDFLKVPMCYVCHITKGN
jgi:hypothetical protein